jgi:chromate transporter
MMDEEKEVLDKTNYFDNDLEKLQGIPSDIQNNRDDFNKIGKVFRNSASECRPEYLGENGSDSELPSTRKSLAAMESKITGLKMFLLFFYFGMEAFGDEWSLVGFLEKECILRRQWLEIDEFQRIVRTYRILPGSHSLAVAGRIGQRMHGIWGCILAILGFLIPTSLGMFAVSLLHLYESYLMQFSYVRASLYAMQTTVIAILVLSMYRISGNLHRRSPMERSKRTSQSDSYVHESPARDIWIIVLLYVSAAFYLMRIFFPFVLVMIILLSVVLRAELCPKWVSGLIASLLMILFVLGYAMLMYYRNNHMNFAFTMEDGPMTSRSIWSTFLFGLVGGLLTIGEVSTSVFFVRTYAVIVGTWMSTSQFLNSLALAFLFPGPNIVYALIVGSKGSGLVGGWLMLSGMLVPNVLGMILKNEIIERFAQNRVVRTAFEGYIVGLLGILSITVLQLIRTTFINAFAVFSGLVNLIVLFSYEKHTASIIPFLLLGNAMAGQIFYA